MIFDELILIFKTNIFLFIGFLSFSGQIGIPVGTIFFIMLSGSLIYSYFDLFILILIITTLTILGDIVSYKIGEIFGYRLYKKYSNKKIVYKNYNKSKNFLRKHGSLGIFLTRFLFTGFGPALNYLAGIERYNFKKFIIPIFLGELLYAIIFSSLGFIFKETWEDLFSFLSDFSYNILIFLIILVVLKLLFQEFKKKNKKIALLK